jgi:hypothetical protein
MSWTRGGTQTWEQCSPPWRPVRSESRGRRQRGFRRFDFGDVLCSVQVRRGSPTAPREHVVCTPSTRRHLPRCGSTSSSSGVRRLPPSNATWKQGEQKDQETLKVRSHMVRAVQETETSVHLQVVVHLPMSRSCSQREGCHQHTVTHDSDSDGGECRCVRLPAHEGEGRLSSSWPAPDRQFCIDAASVLLQKRKGSSCRLACFKTRKCLRDRGAADAKLPRELADRQRTFLHEPRENCPPSRVAKCIELNRRVSIHLR